MIIIKDEEVLREVLKRYHPALVDMVCFVHSTEKYIILTSAFRKDDPGVHGFWRGIDLRSWVYNHPKKIVDEVNKRWIYDPQRPEKVCAKLHDTGKGIHLHLQAHPNTIKRKEVT